MAGLILSLNFLPSRREISQPVDFRFETEPVDIVARAEILDLLTAQ